MKTQNVASETSPKKQKFLGDRGLILLIAFLSAFIPLSTDLYLPALPRMVENLRASAALVNLTLIAFFVFYAIGTLFWGPMSDKYGRKRILLAGLVLYTLASMLCAVAGNVYQLILFRILQAVGSGAATAVATAMVKDVYSGKKRESVLALVQSMAMISPIVAPIIGAFILRITSWRGVFIALAVIGLLAMTGGLLLEETIGRRYTGSIIQSIGRLGVVAKNKGFTSLLLTFSMMSIPSMAFISASSYIYVDGFGLDEQTYSLYFAANAFFLVLGPLLYIRISRGIKSGSLITASYVVSGLSGLLICVLGNASPWLFAVSLLPATIAGSIIRPPSSNLMLEQVQEDIGSASSLMSCGFTFMSSMGMLLISFNWTNRTLVLGVMYVVLSVISLGLWRSLSQKPFVLAVPQAVETINECMPAEDL